MNHDACKVHPQRNQQEGDLPQIHDDLGHLNLGAQEYMYLQRQVGWRGGRGVSAVAASKGKSRTPWSTNTRHTGTNLDAPRRLPLSSG